VLQNILKANDELAGQVRLRLAEAGIVSFNLIGSPGAGKTALLEQTLPRLAADYRIAVIEGDCATARDAERIEALGVEVIQINTGKGCHIPAHLILQALADLPLDRTDLLLIENVGNLVCPSELDVGETAKVAVLSVPEGDDKPQKYPMLFRQCEVVVLNKIDLIPYTNFSRDRFEKDLREINPALPLFPVSCRTGEGIEDWANWIRERMRTAKTARM
jgi:hydrogenase nickel incorporation protein HypB